MPKLISVQNNKSVPKSRDLSGVIYENLWEDGQLRAVSNEPIYLDTDYPKLSFG